MGILNSFFRWVLLDRMKQIEAFSKSPVAAQDQVLKQLVAAAADTEWGRAHGFSSIKSYEDFAKHAPVQDYQTLKPYIERIMNGEQNVLWPTEISWFAKSSGTTDAKSKFIPVSKESLEECHFKAGKDMYSLYYNIYPEAHIAEGKSLVLGGSHQVNKLNENSYYGDLSAVLMQNLPLWAEFKRTPELSIALMDKWEDKIEKMARATMNKRVTNILGVPTWTIILIRKLFEITGKDNLADIWPEVELYVHGGVSFTPYRQLFQSLIRKDGMHYMETYNASEGFFAIQDQDQSEELLLMLDYGIFYEFIPAEKVHDENPEVVPLEGVKAGQNYAMLISTNAGLWRYMVGDTVRFTSTDPYRIKVSGRTKFFINAFGEELVVENAEHALEAACRETGSMIRDYTAAPIYFSEGGNGAHEWLIEFEKEPDDLTRFVEIFDSALKSVNSDYEAKRYRDMALALPVVRPMPKETFYHWMKRRGKLGGQNKVPRLSNSREFVDDLLQFAAESVRQ
jgi:hypothetical protein